MKYLIPLFALLLLIPITVFADHVPKNSGGSYDDYWYIKEVDNSVGNCANLSFDQGGRYSGIGYGDLVGGTQLNDCIMFKVFEVADLDNQEIKITSSNSVGAFCCNIYHRIVDGDYQANNATQFPANSNYLTIGAGQLYNQGGTSGPTDPVHTWTPDLSAGNQTHVTLMPIHLKDNAGQPGDTSYSTVQEVCIHSGCWNWSWKMAGSTFDKWIINANQTGTELDWWTVQSYNPDEPTPPTGVTATAFNNTTIDIDWTDTIENATKQTPLIDGYHLYYQNGTNASGDSGEWTYITNIAQGIETYRANIFQAGHTYSFKLITHALHQLSEDSSIVTETTTGTSAQTQTFDIKKQTYPEIEDNYFWARDYYFAHTEDNRSHQYGDNGWCVTNLQGSGSWTLGGPDDTSSGAFSCTAHIKIFPRAEVDGVLWEWTGLSEHRHISATYFKQQIWDGAYNVWNGTDYGFGDNGQFSQDPESGDASARKGAGLLWSNCIDNCADSFTPNLSAGTEDDVTFMWVLEDREQNQHASVTFNALTIDGKYYWEYPVTAQELADYPVETMMSFSERGHNAYRLMGLTKPLAPTIDSGEIRNERECELSFTNGFDGGTVVQKSEVYRKCNDESQYKLLRDNFLLVEPFIDDTYLQDLVLEQTDPPVHFEDDFEVDCIIVGTCPDGWVLSSFHSIQNGKFNYQWERDGTTYNNYQFIDSNAFQDQFTFRFNHQQTVINTVGQSTGGWLGISSFGNTWAGCWAPVAGDDGIGIYIVSSQYSPDDHTYRPFWKDNCNLYYGTPFTTVIPTVGENTYWEMIRDNSTSYTVNIYSDELYTNLRETQTNTIPAGLGDYVSGLNYFKLHNINTNQCCEGNLLGNIDNVQYWNGTTAPVQDNIYTPVVGRSQCDYIFANENRIGIGFNSTAFTFGELGAGDTCTDISDNQLVFDWVFTDNSEDLQGYGVQISEDNVTFINSVENTFSTESEHLVTGLNDSTEYYLQWRNMFFNGTSGDWSNSLQCTTLSGGGGGSPVPDPVCTLQQILNPNHECFIPDDECSPITDLKVTGGKNHNVDLGQSKHAQLELTWSGSDSLKINEIITDDTTGIKFGFQQPIEFPASLLQTTISKIPFTIEVAPTECVNEQTGSCVYNNAKYDIPLKIFANSCNVDSRLNDQLTVEIREDIGIDDRWLILGLLALGFFFIIIAGKRKKKKKRKWVSKVS